MLDASNTCLGMLARLPQHPARRSMDEIVLIEAIESQWQRYP